MYLVAIRLCLSQALEVLVRQMNCSDDRVIDTLLSQLKTSLSSKVRI